MPGQPKHTQGTSLSSSYMMCQLQFTWLCKPMTQRDQINVPLNVQVQPLAVKTLTVRAEQEHMRPVAQHRYSPGVLQVSTWHRQPPPFVMAGFVLECCIRSLLCCSSLLFSTC